MNYLNSTRMFRLRTLFTMIAPRHTSCVPAAGSDPLGWNTGPAQPFEDPVLSIITTFICAAILMLSPLPQDGQPFNVGCAPPFTAEQHPIDSDCGIEGAGAEAAKKLESRAKNNFCAVGAGGSGSQAGVTFVSFDRLQILTEKQDFDLADDRRGARGLYTTSDGVVVGEGDVVFAPTLPINPPSGRVEGRTSAPTLNSSR